MLGPFQFCSWTEVVARLTWESPGTQASPECPTMVRMELEDGRKIRGNGSWLPAPSACCHSGLSSLIASFPKEPTEWREIRAYQDGGTRNHGWARLLGEVG